VSTEQLGRIWEWFADTSCRGYSPLYDRICRFVAQDRELLALTQEAPPEAHQPNVLLGVVHYLLLGGLDHPLGAVYRAQSDADPGPLFRDVCLTHRSEVLALMETRRTQTNEVGRGALIGPALTWTARTVGAPLALLDVGTSAGLNLGCDRYFIDYGAAGTTGPPDSEVRIECTVTGGRPPIAARLPAIVARVGLDRSPIDLTNADDARWLLACTWPDTGDRLARTSAAIHDAQRHPPLIRRGDMVDDLPAALATLPRDAIACVTTTWALAYLQREGRERFAAQLAREGHDRPIVWISGEGPGVVPEFSDRKPPAVDGIELNVLGAIVYHGRRSHATALAFVHPHGATIDWIAE
jgi:hypothetical protein